MKYHREPPSSRSGAVVDAGAPDRLHTPPAPPDEAASLQKLGVALLQSGRVNEGIEFLRRSLRASEAQPVAHLNLGVALLSIRRPIDALAHLERAIELNPGIVPAHMHRGDALLQAGRPVDAVASFERVLRLQPRHAEAHVQRALALLGLGRAQEALAACRRALQLDPRLLAAHRVTSRALDSLGRADEALAAIERAAREFPDDALALQDLGVALMAAARPAEAVLAFERALTQRPDAVDLRIGLSEALADAGRLEEALRSIETTLATCPQLGRGHNVQGGLLMRMRRPDDALACFDQAVQLDPHSVSALNNRAQALLDVGRPEAALEDCRQALAVAAGLPDTHCTLGNVLFDLRRVNESLACFERAIELNGALAEAHVGRAGVLLELRRFDEAAASCAVALELKPEMAQAWLYRGNALGKLDRAGDAIEAFERLVVTCPNSDFARGFLFHAQLRACDWSGYDSSARRLVEDVSSGRRACYPFTFLAVPADSAAQLRCAQTFAADRQRVVATPIASERPPGNGRIRVAYLSADFHNHATAYLAAGLFEQHDWSRFEVSAVSFGPDAADAMRERLRAAFEHFLDVRSMADHDVAQLLRARGVDIAVDLKGYTTDSRAGILFRRAAPIQVSYLGYPGTLGSPCLDYLLADRTVVPPEDRQHYAEQVVYLPGSYQINDRHRPIAGERPSREALGLPAEAFVFCSFNNVYKFTPRVFDVWMRLLLAIPGSVLWLLAGHEEARDNLRREAQRRGVDATRLVFAQKQPLAEHLARYREAELFLDTLPINAHTTASDALWAGVPVLTCRGDTFAGRVAASLLGAVGLPQLVTADLDEYERLALHLAREPGELRALRQHLDGPGRFSTLFDTNGTCRAIETAFETMWERYRRGEPPCSFSVEAS